MEKEYIFGQSIPIINPSELVLSVDDFFRLSKKMSAEEILQNKQSTIYEHLGPPKSKKYPKTLMFDINTKKIEDEVNEKFVDGIYLDEYGEFSQSSRTIRTKHPSIKEPLPEKVLSPNKITSITVGNYKIMEYYPIIINKNTDPTLTNLLIDEENIRTR